MTHPKRKLRFLRRLKVSPDLRPGAVKIVPPICASSIKYGTKTPFGPYQLLVKFRFLSYLGQDLEFR
jgi:hypothetical protein